MSFVPAPQQANAAGKLNTNKNELTSSSTNAAAAAAAAEATDPELLFKIRTFDVYWVDKYALMYKDGIAKVRVSNEWRGARGSEIPWTGLRMRM